MIRIARWGLLAPLLAPVAAIAAGLGPGTYGESLLQSLATARPEVRSLALHVTPPRATENVVVAATDPSEIGSRSDAAALAILTSGQTTSEVSPTGDRLRVLLPLHDVSSDAIGVLAVGFDWRPGADRALLERTAEALRDQLHRRISHAGNLLDPYPYDPDAPLATYAQKLADEFLNEYRDIQIFAIHATPPGGDYNVIAGSNIGRIGKKADNDDMRCVYTGKPNLEVNATGKRFEVEMQLHDRAGRVIGAVSVVYGYRAGDDKAALHARAERVRASLEQKIPDSDSLFRPAP